MGGFEVSGQSLGCCYQVEVGEMGDPNRCQQPFIPRFRRSALLLLPEWPLWPEARCSSLRFGA